jgi:fluoroquinolone transport system permease protein
MRQAIRLLKGSAIQIYRDQMLLVLCFAPFLMGIALKFFLPLADRLLIKYIQFSIQPYYLMADALILTMGAMTIGMMVGLLMLDERDDGICAYFSVTPVGGVAYLVSRLALPLIYSLTTTLIVISFTALGGLAYGWMFAPAVISAFAGISMAMLLVSIASNKVEGLAVSKLLGILIFGIPLAWFANSYLKVFGYLLPTYWVADMLIQAKAGQIIKYVADFLLGMLCVSIWLGGLYRLFVRKIA